jgi:hypothetical protein
MGLGLLRSPYAPRLPLARQSDLTVWFGVTTLGDINNIKTHLFRRVLHSNLRRGWDSNPRWGKPHNGFRDRPIRPLWHLSD